MVLKNCHSGLSQNLHHSVNWKNTINIVIFLCTYDSNADVIRNYLL